MTVVVLVRSAEKAQRLFAQYGVVVDRIIVGSIADAAVRDALQGCDAVVHAAAVTPMQVASEKELWRPMWMA
jgi:nucleoside-diphosphate-sugar epimerase